MSAAKMADDAAASAVDDKRKRTIHRSPNYPAISLENAIKKARVVLDKEGRHEAAVNVVLADWGYTNFQSSNAQGNLSALVKYGLLKSSGQGRDRKVQLSESAIKILLDEREYSPDRNRLIKDAALLPPIHKELWTKWGASLPSDGNIRTFLLIEKEFNAAVIDEFIKNYKATIAFAQLDKNEGPERSGDIDADREPNLQAGSYVQWTSQGVDQFPEGRVVKGLSECGRYAFVDGCDTGIPINELAAVEKTQLGGINRPPQNPFFSKPILKADNDVDEGVGGAKERFTLDEGPVVLSWPSELSADSVLDFENWIGVVIKRAKRKAGI